MKSNLIGSYSNFDYWLGLPATFETSSKFQRIENINFRWGSNPMTGINRDGFYVVWKGALKVSKTGYFNFYFTVDDGVYVYLEGTLIINRPGSGGVLIYSFIHLFMIFFFLFFSLIFLCFFFFFFKNSKKYRAELLQQVIFTSRPENIILFSLSTLNIHQ